MKEGNLIKENDTVPLVSILRIQPVFVSFAVPEQDLAEIRGSLAKDPLPVEAEPPSGWQNPAAGHLASIDNTVDSSTGTIRLKAVFPNADLRLWPGQFVNVRLRLRIDRQVLVVPSQAVQNGPEGTFTWLVKPDLTVESRGVHVARAHGRQTVIAGGLAEGDTVVTEGQLRLTQGTRVEILSSATKPAAPLEATP